MSTSTIQLGTPTQPPHHLVATWATPFEEALARLAERITSTHLLQLTDIDTTAVLARAGMTVPPVRQVLTFHPRYMRTILERDPAAAVEAPIKITVAASIDGDVTTLRCADPGLTFSAYPTLIDLAAELHEVTAALLTTDRAREVGVALSR